MAIWPRRELTPARLSTGQLLVTHRAAGPNAAQLITAGNGVVLDASNQSTLEMSTSPDGSGARMSLWQLNLTGLKAERLFSVKVQGSGTVAVISGVSAWAA